MVYKFNALESFDTFCLAKYSGRAVYKEMSHSARPECSRRGCIEGFVRSVVFFFLLFVCLDIVSSGPALKRVADHTLVVRVLLDEKNAKPGTCWSIGLQGGARVTDPRDTRVCIGCASTMLTIELRDGRFYLNGKKYWRSQVAITPRRGFLTFEGKQYPGTFEIIKHRKKLFLVNCVTLDKYVASVLKTESWPGWPLELNKAFAITSRSYALAKILEGYNDKKPYHISNTNRHQTYSGVHDDKVLMRAVAQTRGVFLSHKDKPIIAMFDICCGGIIPKHIKSEIDFKKAPYLARSYACRFCKSCKSFNWETEVPLERVGQALSNPTGPIKKITDARVNKTDRAGTVQEVLLKTWPRTLKLTGKKIYSLFKDIKSFCFSIKKKGKNLLFNGKGFGHHLGLCQWGARRMIDLGWDYKRILKFYYPKTKLAKLKVTKKEESA